MTAINYSELMEVSYLNDKLLPRGIRNNNPGNIRISHSKWLGKLPLSQNQDKAFEQFTFYYLGVRAMIVLIRNYIIKYKLNTVSKVLHRWAPTSENHTVKYANYVSKHSGLKLHVPITGTEDELKRLVQAIGQYENGRPAISDKMFLLAYSKI